jgi:hypothetical protein
VPKGMLFAAHLALPDVGPDHFGEAGFPEGAAARHQLGDANRAAIARKEREPANCKWPGDSERFSVIATDRRIRSGRAH